MESTDRCLYSVWPWLMLGFLCSGIYSRTCTQGWLRWPSFKCRNEGHRVQTSVYFGLLGVHGFLSLYGSFSCVFPRPTCVMFLRFFHSTLDGNGFTVFLKRSLNDNYVFKNQWSKRCNSCFSCFTVYLRSHVQHGFGSITFKPELPVCIHKNMRLLR